ncbi:MAG: hypothetical protein E7361_03870 [Clostridiales bacterium]|nr:hypothetical protein [Clostridiales bacterium]
MRTKQHAIFIVVIAVMILAMIGMAIAIVLVAGSATTNNSMNVVYTATNVDCKITASGLNYENDEDLSGIEIDATNAEITINASDSDTAVPGTAFDIVDLNPYGRAVYTFEIQNTASATNTNVLKTLASISSEDLNANDNIIVKMGSSEANATEITADSNQYYLEIGTGQETATLVVIVSVKDNSLDIEEFDLGLTLNLGYDIEKILPGGFATFNWVDYDANNDLTIGVINEEGIQSSFSINADSGEGFGYNSVNGNIGTGSLNSVFGPYDDYGLIDIMVSGESAYYTFELYAPDTATYYTTSDFFDGEKFVENFNNSDPASPKNWGSIFPHRISLGIAANSFDYSDWEKGTMILITISSQK